MYYNFWWGYSYKNFLFYGYDISSVVILLITCFALLAIAIAFEWLKLLQAKIRQTRLLATYAQLRTICPTESDTLLSNSQEPGTSQRPQPTIVTRKDKFFQLFNDISLWLSQQLVGYMLMLTIMTYNGYILMTVVIGTTIGYFLFGPAIMKINLQNCRIMRNTICTYDCGDPDKTALIRPDSEAEGRNIESSPVCQVSSSTSSTVICEATNI